MHAALVNTHDERYFVAMSAFSRRHFADTMSGGIAIAYAIGFICQHSSLRRQRMKRARRYGYWRRFRDYAIGDSTSWRR